MTVPVDSTSSSKSRHASTTKKTRVVRRRARATRALDSDSDEEIRREVNSDSDSESHSSLLSSDEESADEDEVSNAERPANGKTIKEEAKVDYQNTPFFAPANSWSDMVAEDTKNGPADLPVIDFADFDAQDINRVPTPPNDDTKSSQQNIPCSKDAKPPTSAPIRNKEPHSSRKPSSQTARQAYQHRLESDPSYVPTVGQFWGHDDRLLDKDLRSLSGWWRGRWQGRGRGRGGGYGRGRPQNIPPPGALIEKPQDVAPVDKPWTHDAFEEMKQSEEQRRSTHASRGTRGSKVHRGRGGKSNAGTNREQKGDKNSDPQTASDPKPTSQEPVVIRVKLPGNRGHIVRTDSVAGTPANGTPRTLPHNLGPEPDDKAVVVHIPNGTQKAAKTIVPPTPPSDGEAPKSSGLPAEPAEASSVIQPQPPVSQMEVEVPLPSAQNTYALPDAVEQLQQLQLSPKDDPQSRAQTESAILRNQNPESASSETRPPLPPLQTAFPQAMQQPTPPYGSPYQYAPQLPPGIAVDPNGYPYEVSSGRPVYLPPPPTAMYNPRPMMHGEMVPPPGMPYTHSRHQSTMSPDYFATHSPSPPVGNLVDPITGAPIFSPPRRHRVEIRPPGRPVQSQSSTSLRSTASPFEPGTSRSSNDPSAYHPGGYPPESYQHHYGGDPSGMAYPPYPHQYYFAEGYTEGYPYAAPAPYVDHNGTVYFHQ